ncbi:MAG: hypothetical protein QOI86_5348 [Actinomycetota bacterium]|jgi:hypothetical protein|nr:hypothetical protein [Actinomycetota bacterium]
MALRTREDVLNEFVRILDQGTTALKRVVEAYEANRNPERDVHWLSLQAGKEFGAITLQHARANDLLARGEGFGAVSEMCHAVEEEAEHYAAYVGVLKTLADPGTQPVEGMYDYVRVKAVENGRVILHEDMLERGPKQFPANHRYFIETLEAMEKLSPWGRQAVGAQFEGGAVGWHWAMSRLSPLDDYAAAVSELEKMIADDEIHHGPEGLRPLADAYTEDMTDEAEEVFRLIRHFRYLEVLQRNEQFLYPMSDEEAEALGRSIVDDTIEPTPLFARAMADSPAAASV